MIKKWLLLVTILLSSTLNSWTQPSQRWAFTKEGKDTLVQFTLTPLEIKNLNLYIQDIETYAKLNTINERILEIKDSKELDYKLLVENQKMLLMTKDIELSRKEEIIADLNKEIKKQKFKKTILYGAGVGVVILCLLAK